MEVASQRGAKGETGSLEAKGQRRLGPEREKEPKAEGESRPEPLSEAARVTARRTGTVGACHEARLSRRLSGRHAWVALSPRTAR